MYREFQYGSGKVVGDFGRWTAIDSASEVGAFGSIGEREDEFFYSYGVFSARVCACADPTFA